MPKVSIIIPVYNGEAHLRQCLDSVRAQTLEDIEIICVDDGSADGSWGILEEYREKDPRFRLLRQENLHVGAARNNGLAHAQGKYVIFWDCDDFFEPNALEILYQRAEETGAEICVCNNDLYDQKTGETYPDVKWLKPERLPEGDTFNRFSNPEHILGFTHAPAWDKLFLRSFLTANALIFPDFRYGEDRAFVYIALCLASRITTINQPLIHYRWNNSESIMGKVSQDPIEFIFAYEFTVDQLIQRDIVPTESLRRTALQDIVYFLHWVRTEADFLRILQYIRREDNGLLQKCDIAEREPGYYYGSNDEEYVRCLLYDEPGDVLAFFMYDIYQKHRINVAKWRKIRAELIAKKVELKETRAELKETRAELRKTKGDLDALRGSRSYRLGRALLYIPRKIRDLFRRSA